MIKEIFIFKIPGQFKDKLHFLKFQEFSRPKVIFQDFSRSERILSGALSMKIYRIFDFFSVRLVFISPNEHQKQKVFSFVVEPQVKIPLLVFMSEMKIFILH